MRISRKNAEELANQWRERIRNAAHGKGPNADGVGAGFFLCVRYTETGARCVPEGINVYYYDGKQGRRTIFDGTFEQAGPFVQGFESAIETLFPST